MKKWAIISGVAAFLIGCIALIPATWLIDKIPQKAGGFEAWEVDGRMVNGQIGEIRYQGLKFTDSTWDMSLLRLLLLTAQFDVDSNSSAGNITGTIRATLFNRGIRDLFGPLAVAEIAGLYGLRADGQVLLDIKQVDLQSNGHPEYAAGVVNISELRWSLVGPLMNIGDVQATITTEDDVISVVLQELDANIELDGQVILNPDGSYSANIGIRPRATAERRLTNYIRSIGKPDAQGWFRVARSGNLPG